MNSSQLIEAYARFRNEIENRIRDLPLLNYDEFNVAGITTASTPTFVFNNMRQGFGMNLLNELHEFGRQIVRLEAWAAVFDGYSEEDRFDLLLEFVYPAAVYCLNFPYQVRQRLIYTAAHLVDLPLTFSSGAQSRLPTERSINQETMRALGAGWQSFSRFDSALEAINDPEFCNATANYRRDATHRLPVNIEIGYSEFLTRSPDRSEVAFGLGGRAPMRLVGIIPTLRREYSRIRTAILAWRELAAEIGQSMGAT